MSGLLASSHPAADQPDGHADEEHRQCEQPAALDPLERPEVAGRLVVGPLCVAVLDETRRRGACAASYAYSAARSSNEGRGAELLEEADREVGSPNTNFPPLVHHSLVIHAAPGRFEPFASSGAT